MNNCCHSNFFGGIGIGRMPDFCHTCGVEATMEHCRCRNQNRCGCHRQTHGGCGCADDTACRYTTTERCGCDCD